MGRAHNGGRGGEGREKKWMISLDTLSVHCVSYTDHDMHVVEEHCRKE